MIKDLDQDLGILIAPGQDGSLVFCSKCQDLIYQGIRVIRYNKDLKMFDEIGIFHGNCLKDPIKLLKSADYHFVPAIFLRSAL